MLDGPLCFRDAGVPESLTYLLHSAPDLPALFPVSCEKWSNARRGSSPGCLMPVTRVPHRETSCFLSLLSRVPASCGSGIYITSQLWRSMLVDVDVDVGGYIRSSKVLYQQPQCETTAPSHCYTLYHNFFHSSGGWEEGFWKHRRPFTRLTRYTVPRFSPRSPSPRGLGGRTGSHPESRGGRTCLARLSR